MHPQPPKPPITRIIIAGRNSEISRTAFQDAAR